MSVTRLLGWTACVGGSLGALVLYTSAGHGQQVRPPQIDPRASYPCCNIQSGEIIGDMPMSACVQMPGHAPKIPGLEGTENICRPPDQGGGAGGSSLPPAGNTGQFLIPPPNPVYEPEPVWENYRPSIPNGSFESWSGPEPAGFANFRTPDYANDPPPEFANWNSVERSNDSIDGGSSIEISNFKPGGRLALYDIVLPGGAVSCDSNCAILTGRPNDNLTQVKRQLTGGGAALCGAYKSFLVGGDTLSLAATFFAGGDMPVGVASETNVSRTRLSRDEDGWVRFQVPIMPLPGETATATEVSLVMQIMPGGGLRQITPGALAGMPNANSRILVDALHLCGGADLVIADGTSAGGEEVPDDIEESVGAMAWLNIDNDDGDGMFDRDDDRVEGGDNELAQLTLRVPTGSSGTVTLRRLGGEGPGLRLFTSREKAPGDVWAKLDDELELPGEFTDNGVYLERVLYVEGTELNDSATAAVFELEHRENERSSPTKDQVRLTILALDNMYWHGDRNSRTDGNALDPDPMHPIVMARAGGPSQSERGDDPLRLFPGDRFSGTDPADGQRRNEVELELRLNAIPPRPVEIFLRSFDVDDPSAFDDEVDDETSDADNRGTDPGGAGVFAESGAETHNLRMANASERTVFQTTMQPGDNFRIAAFGDRDFLERLENPDTRIAGQSAAPGSRLVDPQVLDRTGLAESAEIPEAGRFVSDTLTVWRFLHVEMDSMMAASDPVLTGSVTSVDFGGSEGPTQFYQIGTNIDIIARRPPSDLGAVGQANSFQRGRLMVNGDTFDIIGNTANGAPTDVITVSGAKLAFPEYRAALINQEVRIEDDDFRVFPAGGSLRRTGPWGKDSIIPLPPTERLEDTPDNPYHKAYVFPRLDTLRHNPGSVPFVGNLRGDGDINYIRSFFDTFDARGQHDNPDLWTVFLLGAYQGIHKEDADPDSDGGVAGEADGAGGIGALIYWVSGGELDSGNGSRPGWRLIDTPPHEIGHLFGGDHADTGLMSDGVNGHPQPTDTFSPKTLDAIRRARNP